MKVVIKSYFSGTSSFFCCKYVNEWWFHLLWQLLHKKNYHMEKDCILVIGAGGQIGTALTAALRRVYGNKNVVAADLAPSSPLEEHGPYVQLDVLNGAALSSIVSKYRVTQIYLLAAMLSASGEKNPQFAWQLNMQGLLNVLDIAYQQKLHKIFWPSSIAVFGPNAPKENCPQHTIMEPTTIYGISKQAGEGWCEYYHQKYGVDVRSLRYPGLISYESLPGGGTTDYAVDIFHQALKQRRYTCFLQEDTLLPMMYMPDAIRATLELMEAKASGLSTRRAYNIAAISFTPGEIADIIRQYIPSFEITYAPDQRQAIADSWPGSIDDSVARRDWGWEHEYGLSAMTKDMLFHLAKAYPAVTEELPQLHPAVFS